MSLLSEDKKRKGTMPLYQTFYRLAVQSNNVFMRKLYGAICRYTGYLYHSEISSLPEIGPGLYIGHPWCITINGNAKLGKNCNLQKNVTIGQANRGSRQGCPIIGDNVWIGINATVVGRIKIGNDVLIAPNSYVNVDVPSHSVVFGNPCQIHHNDNATEAYIINTI
jgi:Serine acetyltransferase